MRKTQKKVFGLLGLSLVAGMTVAAAALPNPGASAVTSMTDTITVRVVGTEVEVTVEPKYTYIDAEGETVVIEYGEAVDKPEYLVTISYQDIETLKSTLTRKYYNAERELITEEIDLGEEGDDFPDYIAGSIVKNLSNYMLVNGYGRYIFTATGYGYEYVEDEENPLGFDEAELAFEYTPVFIREKENGSVVTEIADDDTIDHVVITVSGSNTSGTPVNATSGNLTPEQAENISDLPAYFGELIGNEGGLLYNGEYTFTITAYDSEGNIIYKTFTFIHTVDNVPVPDTGAFFQGRFDGMSEDYVTTAIIVFMVLSVVGAGIIIRKNRDHKVSRKRR